MSNSPEIINIDIEKIDVDTKSSPPTPINIRSRSPSAPSSRSVNFGPGAEMLMNNSKKSVSVDGNNEINLDDLNKLEDELNSLTNTPKTSRSEATKDMMSMPSSSNNNDAPIKLNIEEPTIKLSGLDNSNSSKNDDTWDGYKKFNEIPVDPGVSVPRQTQPEMTNSEKNKQKSLYLRRLEFLKKKGAQLSRRFTSEDSYDDIKNEYDNIVQDKKKESSLKWQGHAMMAIVRGLEAFNSQTDWFGVNLDGWGESVSENIDDFDDVFEELHNKYSGSVKMGPELSLLMQLGGSAMMVHITNSMFKSSMPGMEDIMRQNPELMQQFSQAAVNSMAETKPGFGNFMNGMMNSNSKFEQPQQQQRQQQQQSQRRPDIPPGPRTNSTDVGMDRGYPQFNDSVDVTDNYGSYNKKTEKPIRPDMKGPTDINDLLSGLKTKVQPRPQEMTKEIKMENGSTISIDELKSISKDADNVPRKSKRKPRSERNTVSLDI